MADKYLCQKSCALDKVVPAKRKTEMKAAYAAEGTLPGYRNAPKFDGCQAIVKLYVDGRIECLSRTGEEYVSFLPAARMLQANLMAYGMIQSYSGLVVFAEAWYPGADNFHAISGTFRRGEESDKLGLMVFDVVTMPDYDRGYSPMSWENRQTIIKSLPLMDEEDTFQPAAAQRPLWTEGDAQPLSDFLVKQGGYDGAVSAKLGGDWTQGLENGDEWIKWKARVSLDLRVTAVHEEPGAKTGRAVFSITVVYKGVESRVGSGMPHNRAELPRVGDIVEVVCMAINKNNTLREPRYKGIRFDKTQPD